MPRAGRLTSSPWSTFGPASTMRWLVTSREKSQAAITSARAAADRERGAASSAGRSRSDGRLDLAVEVPADRLAAQRADDERGRRVTGAPAQRRPSRWPRRRRRRRTRDRAAPAGPRACADAASYGHRDAVPGALAKRLADLDRRRAPRPSPIDAPAPRASIQSAKPAPVAASRLAMIPWRPLAGVVGQMIAIAREARRGPAAPARPARARRSRAAPRWTREG